MWIIPQNNLSLGSIKKFDDVIRILNVVLYMIYSK